MPKRKIISYLINFGVILLVFAFFLLAFEMGWINRYYRGLLILMCINATITVALNLATGLLGELCLGHAGFMAVGAYTAALISLHSGLDPLIGLGLGIPAGAITAGVAAFLVGVPALRLRGDYLAIITLAFGEIITIVLRTLPFTGGARGLNGIPLLTTFPLTYFTLVFTIFIVYALIRSRHGRAILAIREDDIAAEASGIDTTRFKMMAFVISAMLAGIGGAVFAHYQGILNPDKFDYNYSIDFMVMVVFGGMGSITGSVASAIVLTALPELLRGFADWRMLIYAVLLIVLMIFKPSGLLGQRELSQRFFYRAGNRFASLFGRKLPALQSEIAILEEEALIDAYDRVAGVGGSSAEPEENLPVAGTSEAEADSRIQQQGGLDSGGDEPGSRQRPGRR